MIKTDAQSRLRVGYLVGRFPVLYERAVQEEIEAVAREGVDPRVFTLHPGSDALAAGLSESVKHVDCLDIASARGPLVCAGASLGSAVAACVASPRMMGFAAKPIHARPGSRVTAFWRRVRLARLLWSEGVHLFHAQFGHLGLLAVSVTNFLGIPLVVSFRGEDVRLIARTRQKIRAYFFKYVSSVLARSRDMRGDLVALGCPEGKIRVLPSPIDVSAIPYHERKPPGNGAEVTVLMAGRLVPKKGMDDALVAVTDAMMDRNGLAVRIAGDGPELPRLKRYVSSLELDGRVTFLGAISHEALAKEMSAAHLFMLPCRVDDEGGKEGIPNVIKEAMASGMPVLSTHHAGIAECVENNESGLLVPEGDVSELAAALLELLSHGDRWQAMGRAGRKIVEARYDVRGLAPRLVQHYHSIIQEWQASLPPSHGID